MSDTVIQVENLWKEYRLGAISHHTLSRDLQSWWARVRGKDDPNSPLASRSPSGAAATSDDRFWALRDVSFEIKKGDIFGIIGRNGAGKSTLLKVLSQVTNPTRGCVRYRGNIASLLEVGTGFHPELSGRENIFLNGAILGMSKADIRTKLDEIVAFAEVEKFLDTPVKRYSSGMYVRLAFAVAAHLEPDILIVDEVLAVGDAQFQQKCLGKMEDVSAKEGRTVLFVSHNMGAVLSLCNKGIVLSAGEISHLGAIQEVVSSYNGFLLNSELSVENCSRRGGSGGISITRIWITDARGRKTNSATSTEELTLNLEARVDQLYQQNQPVVVGFGVDSLHGQRLFTCISTRGKEITTGGERLAVRCTLPSLPLVNDKYWISASVSFHNDTLDYVEHCEYLEIAHDDASFTRGWEPGHGYVDVPYRFEVADV